MTTAATKAASDIPRMIWGNRRDRFNKGRYNLSAQREINVPSCGRVWFASRMAQRAGERVMATRVDAQIDSKYAKPIGALWMFINDYNRRIREKLSEKEESIFSSVLY